MRYLNTLKDRKKLLDLLSPEKRKKKLTEKDIFKESKKKKIKKKKI